MKNLYFFALCIYLTYLGITNVFYELAFFGVYGIILLLRQKILLELEKAKRREHMELDWLHKGT